MRFPSSKTGLLFLLLVVFSNVSAQYLDNPGFVFPQNEVTRMEITIDPDSLNTMISTLESEHEFPAQLVFISNNLTDTIQPIGFRLRGNTSLNAAKKSFKISINAFTNNSWQGLEKLNLIAQHNDPSLLRSKICYDAYRAFGVAAARTAYTELYINGEYRGIYLNVEHIDERFSERVFDQQGDGNLYKCTYPADLAFISNNPDDYKYAMWGVRNYELQTNEMADDYSDLAHLIDVINNTFQGNLTCELPRVFNVEAYLRQAALEVLLGSWDAYIFNKNNYYLYQHQLTQQFQFIPYDLDNTLGIDWVGIDWTSRNIYGYAPSSEQRPLFKKLMLNPTYRGRFSQHIQDLCNGWLSSSNIQSQITQWQTMIAPYVQTDPYYPLDYGFDYADFLQAHTTAQGGHVAFGILPFLEARRSAALSQLESYTTNTSVPFHVVLEGLNGAYRLKARISGVNGSSVIPSYSMDNSAFTDLTWNADAVVADEYHSVWFEPQSSSDRIYFRLRLPDGTVYPCATPFSWITAQDAGLHINECMSSNSAVVADEWGELDDWVELFSSSTPFWSDLYITDDSVNTNRFALPNLNFASNPFPLIWLDDDREQGDFHAGFKLSNGERLFLYQLQDGVPRLLDKTDVLALSSDASWQRMPNGSAMISLTATPTPGGSNGGITEVENTTSPALLLYPNPAQDWIRCSTPLHDVRIYDTHGKCVASFGQLSAWNIQSWAEGCYFIQSNEGTSRFAVMHH